jgi:intracellular sulfur oxidation DsrE/DsrF family protein
MGEEGVSMKKYRVIFHIDEPSKGRANQVLMNITNLLDDLGQDVVEVELLANGGGVRAMARGSESAAGQVEVLAQRGVHFVACQHSLEHLSMQREELLDLVDVVPAGVSELVTKQAEGWAYIRP